MAAKTNAIVPKAGYNNLEVSYVTPVDADGFMVDGMFRIANAEPLALRNFADNANVDIFELNASDELLLGTTFDIKKNTYTPTYTPSGSMTFGSTTTIWASANTGAMYLQCGNIVYIQFRVDGTIAGTPSTSIAFDLPVNAVAANQWLNCYVFEAGGAAQPGCAQITAVGTVTVTKSASATWSAGSGGFIVRGIYFV